MKWDFYRCAWCCKMIESSVWGSTCCITSWGVGFRHVYRYVYSMGHLHDSSVSCQCICERSDLFLLQQQPTSYSQFDSGVIALKWQRYAQVFLVFLNNLWTNSKDNVNLVQYVKVWSSFLGKKSHWLCFKSLTSLTPMIQLKICCYPSNRKLCVIVAVHSDKNDSQNW